MQNKPKLRQDRKFMKSIFINFMAMLFIFICGGLAQAHTWTGPATGANEGFSMAAWLYEGMVNIGEEAGGIDTVSNTDGGYAVTYTGDTPNQINCQSTHLDQSNGLWICQINDSSLTDGPLARGLANRLLQSINVGTQSLPNGVLIVSNHVRQIQMVMKYTNGSVQAIGCRYRGAYSAISWAQCSLK